MLMCAFQELWLQALLAESGAMRQMPCLVFMLCMASPAPRAAAAHAEAACPHAQRHGPATATARPGQQEVA